MGGGDKLFQKRKTRKLSSHSRKKFKKGHSMDAVTSVPCFEFWILLHYKMTTQGFYRGPGSACRLVIRELKQFIPDYEKSSASLFSITTDRMDNAVQNAQKVIRHCSTAGTDDPSTKIHELVLYLRQLKDKKQH